MMKKKSKAVALKYDKEKDAAPRITAKGRGFVAEKIIEAARAHNVPLHEDKNLVQVLEVLKPPGLIMFPCMKIKIWCRCWKRSIWKLKFPQSCIVP
jgi:hypothetical protein